MWNISHFFYVYYYVYKNKQLYRKNPQQFTRKIFPFSCSKFPFLPSNSFHFLLRVIWGENDFVREKKKRLAPYSNLFPSKLHCFYAQKFPFSCSKFFSCPLFPLLCISVVFDTKKSRPGVDQQIAVLHELNTALTMASGHPSQNRVGGVIQALVPLLSGPNNEVCITPVKHVRG